MYLGNGWQSVDLDDWLLARWKQKSVPSLSMLYVQVHFFSFKYILANLF